MSRKGRPVRLSLLNCPQCHSPRPCFSCGKCLPHNITAPTTDLACQGYCRAATILRYLLKNSKRSDHCINSSLSIVLRYANLASVELLPDLVKSFVKNGLYNSEHHRHRPSDTYYVSDFRDK
jgi:hypothetical protein